jgi:hypothetical protein
MVGYHMISIDNYKRRSIHYYVRNPGRKCYEDYRNFLPKAMGSFRLDLQ